MTDVSGSTKHQDLSRPRIRKDESAVQSLVELMEDNWTDPFGHPSEVVCLSTGATASPEISKDLITAHEQGNIAYLTFLEKRLDKQEIPFFDPLPKRNLKTFDNKKKVTRKAVNKEIILKSDRKLFGHMLLVASSRQLNMKDVLQHPLGPLPWALANDDGSLKKTNKSALARKLEGNSSPAEIIPQPSACIIDGMSMLHKMRGDNITFEELSNQLLASVLRASEGHTRIDLIFDVYQPLSIKQTERTSRGSEQGIRFTNIAPGHKIQQWRRLLMCGASKTKLISFILTQWQQPQSRQQLGQRTVFFTSGKKCFQLQRDSLSEVAELASSQEEADTRILLHAKHAAGNYSAIVVVAEDTDVFVLCLAFQSQINCSMYMKCGSASRIRYIDIQKVAGAIGQNICASLIGLHAFTGCDSVSSFSGRGKLSALKLLKDHVQFQETFKQLGQEWTLSEELMTNLEIFTCRLYSAQTDITEVNEMRYQLFRIKNGDVDSSQLPPCKDSLKMHAVRANYQAAIWQRSLNNNATIQNPVDCSGWTLDDQRELTINWITGPMAPDALLEFLSCKCARNCQLPSCQCMVNGLKCTEACRLQTCDNMKDVEDAEDFVDSDSDSDDE